MSSVLIVIDRLSFPIEFFLAAGLLMLPLNKRPRFKLRLTAGILLLLSIAWLTEQTQRSGLLRMLSFFFLFVLVTGLFCLCCRISFWDALLGAAMANAIQHLGYVLTAMAQLLLPAGDLLSRLLGFALFALSAGVCYSLFGKKLAVDGSFQAGPGEAIRALIIVLPVVLVLNALSDLYYHPEVEGSLGLILLTRAAAALCCIYVLWIQAALNQRVAAELELNTQKLLVKQQREQYEMSRENVNLINRKCHDLKHQIHALRHMDTQAQRDACLGEIERAVMIYDSGVRTGNEVLDIILSERSLSCEKEGISWTCMANGAKLDFLDPADLYSIFGNALDNAMESVRALQDPEQRTIAVTLYTRGNFSVLQIENYYQGELILMDGLPQTTKADRDFHGFGVKSIRSTVEKYGGTISIDTQDHIYLLSIVIPVPEK